MYLYDIAICDDESYYREEIIKMFAAYQSESGNRLTISEYSSGEDLLEGIKKKEKPFDIIILDVEMKAKTGVETAKEIRREDDGAVIIFATSHDSYALDAFAVGAAGYLVKPVNYVELKKIMMKSIVMADFFKDKKEAEKRYLNIMTQHEKMEIEIDRIIYIEKERNKARISTRDGEYSCYETLSELYKKLDQRKFTYCHQGFLVNFEKVKDVEKTKICFGSNIDVPLSRKYYKELRERFMQGVRSSC